MQRELLGGPPLLPRGRIKTRPRNVWPGYYRLEKSLSLPPAAHSSKPLLPLRGNRIITSSSPLFLLPPIKRPLSSKAHPLNPTSQFARGRKGFERSAKHGWTGWELGRGRGVLECQVGFCHARLLTAAHSHTPLLTPPHRPPLPPLLSFATNPSPLRPRVGRCADTVILGGKWELRVVEVHVAWPD